MKSPDNPVFRIGAGRVDPAWTKISMPAEPSSSSRRPMLLLSWPQHAFPVVSVEQLHDQVWKRSSSRRIRFPHAVAALRLILGFDAKNPT